MFIKMLQCQNEIDINMNCNGAETKQTAYISFGEHLRQVKTWVSENNAKETLIISQILMGFLGQKT